MLPVVILLIHIFYWLWQFCLNNRLPHHQPCFAQANLPFPSLFTSLSSIATQLYRFLFHFWKTTTAVKITVRNSYGDDNDNHKKKKKMMLLTYILCFHTQKMATATITMTGTTIAMATMALRRWPDVPCPSIWFAQAFDVLEFLMKVRIGKRSNTNIVYSSTNKFIINQNKTFSIILSETFTVSLPSRC